MRKIAFPIYVLALGIMLAIGSAGYVIINNRQHDKELAAAVVERNRAVNETLRGMCDRFELRDEIFLRILEQSAELQLNILALRLAQGDCLKDIPRVIQPPHVP
jgi:hypothetical protein